MLNKIDLVKKDRLLALSAELACELNPEQVFMISAAHGDGVPDLKQALAEAMPEGPWLFPDDEVSDATDRMIAAELTREQIVNQLYQELPYAAAVETETWEDRPDGSTAIRQQILVERDSQKGDRDRQGRRAAQGDRRSGARRDRASTSAGRCICSCT